MKFYQSEITKFINELKEKNPNLELQQINGRNLLWDKSSLNLEEYQKNQQAMIKQKAYVYGTE